MQPLLDHEDFVKSRKALLASSSFLLLAQHISTSGGNGAITVMSLQIDHGVFIGLGCLSVLYFAWVFLFRSVEQATSLRDDLDEKLSPKLAAREAEVKAAHENYLRAAEGHFDPLAMDEDERDRRINQLLSIRRQKDFFLSEARRRINRRLHLRVAIFYLVEFLPPVLLMLWVLTRLDSIGAIGAFLLPSAPAT
jgi:hypothetical protein